MSRIEWRAEPDARWDDAVSAWTDSLFVRARWLRALERGYGRPLLCARADGSEPGAVAGLVLGPPLLRVWFSCVPYGGWCGPAASSAPVWGELLDELRQRGFVQAQWVPEDGPAPPIPARAVTSTSYRRDLPADPEALWADFDRRRRSDVRRARRDGVEVSVGSDPDAVRALWRLYGQTMTAHRARRRYRESLFRAIAEDLEPGDRDLFVARVNGRNGGDGVPVAAALVLYSGARAHYFIAGTDARGRRLGAGDAVMARALERATERGARQFDFMGTPPGDVALGRWKQKWSGHPRMIARYVARLAPIRGALLDLALGGSGARPRSSED